MLESRLEMAERSLNPTFKIADITNLYKDKLAQLNVQVGAIDWLTPDLPSPTEWGWKIED